MPLSSEERKQVRKRELEKIASYCDFKFKKNAIRDGTGTIIKFGKSKNQIKFVMGLTAPGKIEFKFWSNVNLKDQNMRLQLVRNWLLFKLKQQQVENTTLDDSVTAASANKNKNEEGYVAVYTVNNINGNNCDEFNDDQKNKVKNVFETLSKFFTDNIERNQDLNTDIETYNQKNINQLNDYIVEKFGDATTILQVPVVPQQQDTDNSMIETIKDLLLNNHQVILTGAPGTGKTYTAQKVAEALTDSTRISKVQFHPGYDYSDFVIGLKPQLKDNQVVFSWKNGVFKEFADQVNNDNINNPDNINNNYVFIIDEINRADLSRVFGELFSILEEDYRGKGIILPNGNTLVIPNNLYIIGTMNDIDRSVESMDFALRRRFAWYEVSAESSEGIIEKKNINGDDKDKLKLIMEALNKEIGNEGDSKLNLRLGKEYQLGGALFAKFEKLKNYDSLWNNVIKIILNEYLRGRNNREELLQKLEEIFRHPQGNANQSSETNVGAIQGQQ